MTKVSLEHYQAQQPVAKLRFSQHDVSHKNTKSDPSHRLKPGPLSVESVRQTIFATPSPIPMLFHKPGGRSRKGGGGFGRFSQTP